MANRTDPLAGDVHGTNPQFLLGKIVRSKIYDSQFWKEHCFGLTAESLVDKAVELKYIGGTFGGARRATPFLCLLCKLLQIQPPKDVIVEYIRNEEFKYLRALGVFYLRLTGQAIDIYNYLEPLLIDYHKLRHRLADGRIVISHMDEFVDSCLRDQMVLEVDLPVLPKRHILEESQGLSCRISVLDEGLNFEPEELKFEEKRKQYNR